MRHSRDRRRAAAGLYAFYSATLFVVAWASLSVAPLLAGIAFMSLAGWALNHYPVDRDW